MKYQDCKIVKSLTFIINAISLSCLMLVAACTALAADQNWVQEPAAYVDPFIGTAAVALAAFSGGL